MIRDTSLIVYKQIKEEGLLSERRLQVYSDLFKYGPCTANELYEKMDRKVRSTQANIHPRLGELRGSGVVSEITQRQCRITNRTAIVWDVNSKLPIKPKRELSNKQKLKIALDALDFYSDDLYTPFCECSQEPDIIADRGDTAKEALARIKGE